MVKRLPCLGRRTLLLIRHGQAGHNVLIGSAVARNDEGYEAVRLRAEAYELHDPCLTQVGREQSEALARHWKENNVGSPEYLIASPLRRGLETADIAFRDNPYIKRRVVHPLVRERDGGLGRKCDSGRSKRAAIDVVLHPWLWDWESLPECYSFYEAQVASGTCPSTVTPEDVTSGRINHYREDRAQLAKRVRAFLSYVVSHPDGSSIAAVGHGDFWTAVIRALYRRNIRLGNCGYVVCTAKSVYNPFPGFCHTHVPTFIPARPAEPEL
eukprot:gene20650-31822_t